MAEGGSTRVKFEEMPTVILLLDNADSKVARRGPWQTMARDRARFTRRIKQIENVISWVFERVMSCV